MNISFANINTQQVKIIKGIGIILITFHNFLHRITNISENEMNYDFHVFSVFIKSFSDSPLSVFNSFLSYFGHFGV